MKTLISIGDGILGFETIRNWRVIGEADGLMHIQEVDSSEDLERRIKDSGIKNVIIQRHSSNLAQFFLINSIVACESFGKKYPNMDANAWYVIFAPGTNSATINTRAPIYINGEKIEQILCPTGSTLDKCLED